MTTDDRAGRTVSQNDVEIAQSWQRCRTDHRLDPDGGGAPQLLTLDEIRHARDALMPLLRNADEDLDRLYAMVEPARCTIMIADRDAVVLDHRAREADAGELRRHGAWSGAIWSEAIEGSNGIGTAIVEERPLIVRRSEHFRRRHKASTCIGVPLFDTDAALVANLCLASQTNTLDGADLALGLAQTTARSIEQRQFRTRFDTCWIVLCAPPGEHHRAGLLAVDRDHRVAGADRRARAALGLDCERLRQGVGIWSLFDPAPGLVAKTIDTDFATILTRHDGAEAWHVLITPPQPASHAWRRHSGGEAHVRPRWLRTDSLAPSRRDRDLSSGLAPRILRRVTEHIETRLYEALPLAELAAVAGLSQSYFSEAFRRSTGMPPHRWILLRRVELAKRLLLDSGLTITEVAFSVGFSSSSHLASAFRRVVGSTPSQFKAAIAAGDKADGRRP
ncbi:MAG: sigma-54-dependent Fis family transcriptional regulator [Rhodospirillales bacterium]|nr:sigma-54-dependent Fis family transcriptional regulator [Rhodospirillales bacterium]